MATISMAQPVPTSEEPPSDPRSDGALVAATRTGDPDAFAELHRRYARVVHGVLLARVPVADADDLVQDVFLQALERLPSLRDDGAFGGWLVRITRNRATDHLRRRRTVVPLPDGLSRPPRRQAEVAEVLAALGALPEAFRETLILRLVEGLSGPEIAALTGRTPGSIRVNLHRGMALLRERLGVTP